MFIIRLLPRVDIKLKLLHVIRSGVEIEIILFEWTWKMEDNSWNEEKIILLF